MVECLYIQVSKVLLYVMYIHIHVQNIGCGRRNTQQIAKANGTVGVPIIHRKSLYPSTIFLFFWGSGVPDTYPAHLKKFGVRLPFPGRSY